jgi:glycosyltransferase involved in cell wall biosynthesis
MYAEFLWHSVMTRCGEFIRDYRPDAVIAYWAHPDGEVASRIGRLLGAPSITISGGSDVLVLTHDAGRRAAIKRALSASDAIVTVSEHLKEAVVALGLARDKVHVIRRGIDHHRFCPGDRDAARRLLGVRPDVPLLLCVGRLTRVKGIDVLLQSCDLLARRKVPFRLAIVGAGSDERTLRALSVRLNLADRVTFEGSVPHEELPVWYRAAHYTVLPSRSEGVPNVLLESIACGTPVIASDVGGISEVAQRQLDFLVPPNDPMALAAAITAAIAGTGADLIRVHEPYTIADAASRLSALAASLVAANVDIRAGQSYVGA